MSSAYTILVDNREKKALTFPSTIRLPVQKWDGTVPSAMCRTALLHTTPCSLETGDYQLEGFPGGAVVERKSGAAELETNLFTENGRRKFLAELHRMKTFSRRVLLIEESVVDWGRARTREVPPHVIRHELVRLCGQHAVELFFAGTSSASAKLATGEWVAAILIEASR